MSGAAPWGLAIDFGTSNCVVVARVDDGPSEVIEVGGERRIPSVVFVTEAGDLVVGRVADDLAVADPARALRSPKAHLGEPHPVVIAGRTWDVTSLVSAVLGWLAAEAVAQIGSPASEVRLTHPATWGAPRRDQLRRAAVAAGLAAPVLIPEPVAAAVAYAEVTQAAEGSHVAVYDLGGGTYDTTVLRVDGPGSFEIVGQPTGDGRIGGELFDDLLLEEVRAALAPATRDALATGSGAEWMQADARLRVEVRRAKEALSSHPHVDVVVATPTGFERTRVTRARFEELIRPWVDESVAILERTVIGAGLAAADLSAIHLAGGTSRVPLVEARLRSAFPGVPVTRRGDPKTSVAIGAAMLGRADLPADPDAADPVVAPVAVDAPADGAARPPGAPPGPSEAMWGAPVPGPGAAAAALPVLPAAGPDGVDAGGSARPAAAAAGADVAAEPPSEPPSVPEPGPRAGSGPSSEAVSAPGAGPRAGSGPSSEAASVPEPGPPAGTRRPRWVVPAAVVAAVALVAVGVGLAVAGSGHSGSTTTPTTSAAPGTTGRAVGGTQPGGDPSSTVGTPPTTLDPSALTLAQLGRAVLQKKDFSNSSDFTEVPGGALCGGYTAPTSFASNTFRVGGTAVLDSIAETFASAAKASSALSQIPTSRSYCTQGANPFTLQSVHVGATGEQSYAGDARATYQNGQPFLYFLGIVRYGRNLAVVEVSDSDLSVPLGSYESIMALAGRKLRAVLQ